MWSAALWLAMVAVPGMAPEAFDQGLVSLNPGAQRASADPIPFAGEWTANLSKSRQNSDAEVRSAKLVVVGGDKSITLTRESVYASGQKESLTSTLQFDGVDHPSAKAPGLVSRAWWAGDRTFETTWTNHGQVIARGKYAMSAGGDTLTVTSSGWNRWGAFDEMIVFERR